MDTEVRQTGKKSNYDVGATVYLDGEKEYKQACADITKAIRGYGNEMKLVKSEFIGNENSLKSLKKQYEVQKDIIAENEERIRTLNGALEAAKEKYGDNSRQVKDWEDQLRKAKTQLNLSRAELEKLEDQKKVIKHLKDGFEDFKEQAEKVKDALGKVGTAGKNLAKLNLKAVTTSVKGLGVAAGAVATAAGAAGAEMIKLANDAAAAGKEIAVMSERTGLSTKAYQEWDYIAKQAGTTMDTLQGGITDLAEKMDDAAKGEGEAAEIFEKLGVNVTDSTGKLKKQEVVFEETIKALQGVKNETERQALATKLMSTTGEELLPLLNGEIGSIKELKKAASEMGLVMSEEAVDASVKFEKSLTDLKSVLTATKNNMSAEFLPGLTTVMNGITGLFTGDENAVDTIKSGVSDIADTFGEISPQITDILSVVISSVSELAPEVIGTLATGISDTMPGLATSAANVITTLVTGLVENMDKIIEAANTLITKLSNSLLKEDNLEKIINASVDLVITLVSAVADNIDLIINAAITIIDTLVESLTDEENMPKLVDGAVKVTFGIIGGLLSAIPDLIKAAGELIAALVDALFDYDWGSVGSQIWAKIKAAWSGKEDEVVNEVKPHGSHAGGLYRVPFDGYIAELHESERVLTAAQAQAYNRGEYQSNEAVMRQLQDTQTQYKNEMYALRQQMADIANILRGGIPVNVDNTRDIKRAVSGVA